MIPKSIARILKKIQDGAEFGFVNTGFERRGSKCTTHGYYVVGDTKLSNPVGRRVEEWMHWDDKFGKYRLAEPTKILLGL